MSHYPSKGTALITGASRDIGAVYADRLARRGAGGPIRDRRNGVGMIDRGDRACRTD